MAETESNWASFYRFTNWLIFVWKCSYFYSNFTWSCSRWSDQGYARIGLDNSFAPNSQRAIIGTNDGRVRGHHYSDVMKTGMASQSINLTIVYSNFYSGADQKKTSKLRVTGLCTGSSPVTGEYFVQSASNAENVSIWWRHHDICVTRPRWVMPSWTTG